MQSTNVIRSPDTYGKMTEMSSGRNFQCGIDSRSSSLRETLFTGSSMSNCSRIEDSVEFIDEKEDTNACDEPTDALYNFPWDFKNKANQLLLQTSMTDASKQNSLKSQTSHSSIPPPPPQCPPPSSANSTLQTTIKIEEDEYCAPWDLKLQEEMFKKMSQQKKNAALTSTSINTNTNPTQSSNSPDSEIESINNNATGFSTLAPDSSVKSQKPMNDSTPRQSIQPNNIEESNEYSPPWELKQSILMQTIQSQNNANSNNNPTKLLTTSMPAPLCTSSTTSTLTNSTNQQNPSALASLFNQFSRTRLSTRSNTSSSSSTRSSSSSLSASSPPSIPPPPLPPSIPPPPPPTSTSIHRCNSLCNHNNQHIQQSPRLSHRHLCQTNSSSNLIPGSSNNTNSSNNNSLLMSRSGGAGLLNGSSCNSCSLKNTIIMNATNSTYLNESTNNKFCSWGTNSSSSNSSNTNSFDTNNFISDESKSSFSKPNRGSNQHFVYPSMVNHFQTAQLGGQQLVNIDTSNTMNNKTIQIGGIPVTALVFQQTCGSLPANFLPLNMQNQQQVISPTSLSHLRLLERQVWFHGKITRKKAETILENRPIGSFLIRQSESGNANDFSLSLVGSGVVHMRISIKNGEYILGQCSQPFNSIVKMVEHYGKVEVPIKGALHVRLTIPVPIN